MKTDALPPDIQYDELGEQLYAAVLEDVLRELGYPNQVLPNDIKPLTPETKLIGRAATMLAVPVPRASDARPFGLSLEFLDSLQRDEVVVVSAKSETPVSLWGEIMSTAALARGARGVVVDGYGRDTTFIREINFPAFFTGVTPIGSVGRMEVREIRQPVQVGSVTIAPGDLVFGDADGCLAIPQTIEKDVISIAVGKVGSETAVRQELRDGASVVATYEKYGVL